MPSEKNIVYKKKENVDKLKYFTNLLFDKNYSIEKIKKYETDNDFNNFKFRIINLLASHPKLLYYINKHFNNFIGYTISNTIWYDSLRTIIHLYNIQDKNSFKYSKFKFSERKSFKNSISEIYDSLNERDLNELYRLYSIKIINNEHLELLKSSEKINAKLPQPLTNTFVVEASKKEAMVFNKHSFNKNIQDILETKPDCKKCKYFKSEKLFIDGNATNINDLHVLFINDFSNIDDFNRGKIYFEDQQLDKLSKLKYLIVNVLPCNIQNEYNVFKSVVPNCKKLMGQIIDQIKCNFKVLIGPRSRETFNIKIKSTSKYINNMNGNYFLLSSMDENEEKFEEGFEKILSTVKIDYDCLSSYVNTIQKQNTNLTLFDIKIVKNNILYIFCDENGKKQYFSEEVKFPVYIKYGNYRNCEYIESEMDEVVYLNTNQKGQLSGQYMKRLNNAIKLSG